MQHTRHTLAVALVLTAGSFVQANEEVTFRHKNPVVGEQWANNVQFDMKMKTRYRYPGQDDQETSNHDQQRQLRRLTVLAIQPGYSTRVKVHFEHALRQLGSTEQTDHQWLPQPVAGKTYIVERENEEELIVTDDQGNIPTDEELVIVRHSMEAVGRPNPLTNFLSGRTIAIGETVQLPGELAGRFLGSQASGAEAQDMPLKLEEVRDVDGIACGIFSAQLETVTQNGPRASSHMSGHFAVQLETCRIVFVSFRGPVTFRQTRTIANQEYVVEATGFLAVAMRTSPIRR